MDKIIPVSELRSHMSEITKWIEGHRQPVFLTKNGRGRYVILDVDTYNKLLIKAGKLHPRALDDDDDVISSLEDQDDERSRMAPGFSTAIPVESVAKKAPEKHIPEPSVPERQQVYPEVASGAKATSSDAFRRPSPSIEPSEAADRSPRYDADSLLSESIPARSSSVVSKPVHPAAIPQATTPAKPSDSDNIAAQLREEEQRILRELGLA